MCVIVADVYSRSVGAEDDATLTSSERNSDGQLEDVEGSNDAKSPERDDVKAPSGPSTTEPPIWEKVPTPSAVIHNPPAIKLGDATMGSSQREPGIVMSPDSASSEKCLGTLSDFLSRNHQEVREILEQGGCDSMQIHFHKLTRIRALMHA